jgi:hypothetical protein
MIVRRDFYIKTAPFLLTFIATDGNNHPAPAGHPSDGGEFSTPTVLLDSPPSEGWQAKPDGVVTKQSLVFSFFIVFILTITQKRKLWPYTLEC